MSFGEHALKKTLGLAVATAATFALGRLYVLDIRMGGPPVFLGLGAFAWLHVGLLVAAVAAGAVTTEALNALGVACLLFIAEGAGILFWVFQVLATDPGNNLWPLGLLFYSVAGALTITAGAVAGFVLRRVSQRLRIVAPS